MNNSLREPPGPKAGAAPERRENMHFIYVKGKSDNKILINLDQIAAVKTEEFEEGIFTIIKLAARSEDVLVQGDIRSKLKTAILTKGGSVADLT